jgi:Protein of unknown function (DUF3662)/FHA domain
MIAGEAIPAGRRRYTPAVGLQGFERRLERLVEGTFAKAFRSKLEPVEMGRKVARALDAGQTLDVRGQRVAPNDVVMYVSPTDFDRFYSFADVLTKELAEAARVHARDEGYHFVGPVTVELVEDQALRTGDSEVVAEIMEGEGGRVGSLLLPDGQRMALQDGTTVMGRLSECSVQLTDPKASRRHAELRPSDAGWVLVDLGSTNGTTVNGERIRERVLADGDVIGIGATQIRFEES